MTCQLGVGGGDGCVCVCARGGRWGVYEGMNCHSLSELILFLIRDVPYATVGKQDKYLFRYRGGNMNSHSSCLLLTPVAAGKRGRHDGRKGGGGGGGGESVFVCLGYFRFCPYSCAKQDIQKVFIINILSHS